MKYEKEVNKAGKKVRQAKQDFERKIANNVNRDSKSFTYVRSNKVKSSVGPLKNNNGNVISDSQNMCSLLNDFYASVFTQENFTELLEAKWELLGVRKSCVIFI